jgi:DNA-directed RNA polymerase subunit H
MDGEGRSEVIHREVELLMKFRGYRKTKDEKRKDGMDITILDRENEKSLIRIVTESKLASGNVGVNQVKTMKRDLEKGNIESAILVAEGFSHSARREARRNRVELVSKGMLPSFNVFNHELVPKHEILPKEEAEELLRKLRIEPYKLPQIKTSDPIVILIGAKPGDILKVTRKSLTAGSYVSYRYVV